MRGYVLAAVILFGIACPVQAQRAARRQAPAAGQDDNGPITPGEVQRMFDAWTLVQAQDALNLSEAQYGRFVTRLKALQDARRRHQQARMQILGDLRRTLNGPAPADTGLRDSLKSLAAEDERAAAEIRKAQDEVDGVLDVPQQARFRLFEERMEARKLELLLKARQGRAGK